MTRAYWPDRWAAGEDLADARRGRIRPPAMPRAIARGGVVLAAVVARERTVPWGVIVAKQVTISKEAANLLAAECDEVIGLSQPSPFLAVGAAYGDFRTVETAEVRDLLGNPGSGEGSTPPSSGSASAGTGSNRTPDFE